MRVFGSGLAAVAAAYGAVLKQGDTVVMQEGAYFMARQLLQEVWATVGVTVRMAAAAEMAEEETVAGARLVWVETPSNPRLEVVDVRRVCAVAHAAGALVAVDNTTATPAGAEAAGAGGGSVGLFGFEGYGWA